MADAPDNIAIAAEILAAYVANNALRSSDLPGLFGEIHAALVRLSTGASVAIPAERAAPAVAIKQSVADGHLVCLEDGEQYKTLKRHLRTRHNLSPEQYRVKWNLPANYPMVAPAYAKARSALALEIGLGRKSAKRKRGAVRPQKSPVA
jgi:predicted transcriptional regulator